MLFDESWGGSGGGGRWGTPAGRPEPSAGMRGRLPQFPFFSRRVFGAGSKLPKPRWRLRPPARGSSYFPSAVFEGWACSEAVFLFVVSGKLNFFFPHSTPELQKCPGKSHRSFSSFSHLGSGAEEEQTIYLGSTWLRLQQLPQQQFPWTCTAEGPHCLPKTSSLKSTLLAIPVCPLEVSVHGYHRDCLKRQRQGFLRYCGYQLSLIRWAVRRETWT